MGRLARLILLLRIVTHLNIFIAITGLILIEIIIVIFALLLEVLTASIRDIVIIVASSNIATLHLLVLALLVGFLKLLDKGGLELGLLSTVGIAVVVQSVGFGLVGWVLCGRRLIGIP
jgi:hypothetical protein